MESIPGGPEAESPWLPTDERGEMFCDYTLSSQQHSVLDLPSEDLMFTLLYLARHFGSSRGNFPELYGKAKTDVTYSFLLKGIWEG